MPDTTPLNIYVTNYPASNTKYLIVTPVRDEAQYIGDMIKSVLVQTYQPNRWVIVNDGSTDRTLEIITTYTQNIDWITVLNTGSKQRNLGSAEIIAFNKGIEAIEIDDFDFIVKLDADVQLEPDYFREIFARMLTDPFLGIVSGVYCENYDGSSNNWVTIKMPSYHAAGASKVLRRECYKIIGGFVPQKGWDTLDEIRAGLNGWKTGHVRDLVFRHLKPEGMAMGKLSTHRYHGEIYYQTGGGILFLCIKVVHRMLFSKPFFIGGLNLFFGYLILRCREKARLVTKEEAAFYNRMLIRRVVNFNFLQKKRLN